MAAMAASAVVAASPGMVAASGPARSGRGSSVFESLGEPLPKCELISEDVFAIRVDEDRSSAAAGTGTAGTSGTVHCELHLPTMVDIESLWVAQLPYDGDTKRKVLEDRHDATYFYDTFHAPWREVKVPHGRRAVLPVPFAASTSPCIFAASLRGGSFPPMAADKKRALVAFSQVIGGDDQDARAECFVRRSPTVGSKRSLRGEPDALWDMHLLQPGAPRVEHLGTDTAASGGDDEAVEVPARRRSRRSAPDDDSQFGVGARVTVSQHRKIGKAFPATVVGISPGFRQVKYDDGYTKHARAPVGNLDALEEQEQEQEEQE